VSLSVRERIIRKLAARVGAGRNLDSYDARDLPITVLVTGDDEAFETAYSMTRVTMPVTIARAIALTGVKGDDWHSAAEAALAELITEAFDTAHDDDLADLVDGIDYTGGGAEILTDGAKGAAVQISLGVRYAFVHGNPYSQDDLADYDETGDPAP
jgi:hypothetical protein